MIYFPLANIYTIKNACDNQPLAGSEALVPLPLTSAWDLEALPRRLLADLTDAPAAAFLSAGLGEGGTPDCSGGNHNVQNVMMLYKGLR